MNKQKLAQLITILQNQYLRGGQVAKEAADIVILLLGKDDGKYLIKLWDSLIMAN